MNKPVQYMWQLIRTAVLLSLLLPSLVFASQSGNLQFSHLLTDEGISTGAVEAVFQDSHGYIWFGGTSGIGMVQYDGYDFTVHSHKEGTPNTLSSGVVWDIFEDSRGNLWVATDVGINRFDRETGGWTHFVPSESSLGGAFARVIKEDIHGTLWVGFMGGLGRFNRENQEFDMFFVGPGGPNTLSSPNIRSMYTGIDNNIWLGVEGGGLNRFDIETEQIERYSPDEQWGAAAGLTVLGLHQTRDGIVWAGTDNGLGRLDPEKGQFTGYPGESPEANSLRNGYVGPIAEDAKGNLWIGASSGLYYLNRETQQLDAHAADPSRPRNLEYNDVRSLHLDINGGLWVGYFPSGVSYLDRTSALFSTYRHDPNNSNSLSQGSVLSLQQNDDGKLLLGTDGGGLNIFDPDNETFTHYTNDPNALNSLSANAVLTISPASGDKWWVGTWFGGLNLFDPNAETFEYYRASKPGPADNVWAVLEDSRDTLWMGTIGAGLSRYDWDTRSFFWYGPAVNANSTFPSQVVWSIYEDHSGDIWIGSSDGLARYLPETDSFITYTSQQQEPNSIGANVVNDIAQDKQNRLWLATRGGGLSGYDRETDSFHRVRQSDGLPSNVVMSVVPDELGNLWLGTANGISRYTPNTNEVLNYSYKNGLQGSEFNIGAGLKLHNGKLAFGGTQGFTIFDPSDFDTLESAPPVEIVNFEIFNQPVEPGVKNSPLNKTISHTDAITLTHKQSVFSFTYVALSYSDPARNDYAYKLEGFEDKWNYVGNRRIATYTNLDAGRYTFRVKAANSQGVWNETGRHIKLTILPPPWKTLWAYVLYAVLIAFIIYVFLLAQQRKINYQRNISHELEQKVTERTEALQQKNQQLQQAYKQLEEISLSDPLTGLNNRRYLQKLLPMDVASVQRKSSGDDSPEKQPDITGQDLVFLLLDVDHFKSVNDEYGHAAGDNLLVQISDLLTRISRDSDFLVRWGGEEFLLVSRFVHRDEALLMAERIREAVAEYPFKLDDGQTLHKTCSIGYASFPFISGDPQALSWEQVVDTADRALYIAKRSGRNRSVGLCATDSTPTTDLYKHIRENVSDVVGRGELIVVSSSNEPITF